MNKLTRVLLMLALLLTPVTRLAVAQEKLTGPSVAEIKTMIARRLRDEKTNVTVRLRNGSQLNGRITKAADNMFTLKEKKTGTQRDISYSDVTRVKGKGLSKGAKFGILTGILAGAVIIGVLVNMRNFDPFKNGVLR